MDVKATGWDIAGAVEHSAEVKAMRAKVKAAREAMPGDQRFGYPGLVLREVLRQHSAAILADQAMVKNLLSLCLLRLCEETDMEEIARRSRERRR
jgi:hypothetical protein